VGAVEYCAGAGAARPVLAEETASRLFPATILAMSVSGVRREKAALSGGCKAHPATAPAGSNRSSHGGNEMAEAFD